MSILRNCFDGFSGGSFRQNEYARTLRNRHRCSCWSRLRYGPDAWRPRSPSLMAISSEELIEEFHERRRAIGLGESDGVEVELSSSSRAVVSYNLIKIDSGFQRRGLGERTVALLTEMSDGADILLELIPRKPPGFDGMSDH